MAQRTKMFKQKMPDGTLKDTDISMKAQYVDMANGYTAQELIGDIIGIPNFTDFQTQLNYYFDGKMELEEVESW